MKRTKEEKLTKFWNHRINPITGLFDDKRMQNKKKPNNKLLIYESNI